MVSGRDEQGRLETLRQYAVLDTPPEDAFDELARLAAFVCGTPTALITFVDENRQWFKARHNFTASETERRIAFCAQTIGRLDPLVVIDAATDPRFASNPLVTGEPYIRFYAGVPLIVGDGSAVGTLAVLDYQPREISPATLDALVALGHQVVAQLELRRRLREQQRLHHEGVARFELVARATNDAVWDWNLVNGEIWWNEGLRTLFGYPPEQMPTIDTWKHYLHPDDAARVTTKLDAAIAGSEPFWQDQYRFMRHDGTYADILDRGYVIRDEHGRPVRMVGAMLDVTERLRLEDQLRQAQKMDALGQLSGGIAHDFNNLLTVIQVNAALLGRKTKGAPGLGDHTEAIAEATARAASLTRQLLLVSRKQVMQLRVVDVNEVVTSMTRMLLRIVGEQVVLVAQCARDVPLVNADVGMLEQVLLNLVVNARDAMARGGQLTIVTGVTRLAAPKQLVGYEVAAGAYVWVSVSDTGHGIGAEHLPHIFEPFYTTKDIGHGTGLGLATAYGIVRQHRGWIDVESELGIGSTFRFHLPATDQPRTAPAPTASADDELPTGTETILVVEDEAALRRLVVGMLESCGYTVLHAGSGVQALELWKEHGARIQLVLTDIVMPGGVSGRDLADQLRAMVPDLPIVFTSGYSPDLTGKGEPLVEGTNFVRKPYEPAKLARTLRDALDRAAAASRPG